MPRPTRKLKILKPSVDKYGLTKEEKLSVKKYLDKKCGTFKFRIKPLINFNKKGGYYEYWVNLYNGSCYAISFWVALYLYVNAGLKWYAGVVYEEF